LNANGISRAVSIERYWDQHGSAVLNVVSCTLSQFSSKRKTSSLVWRVKLDSSLWSRAASGELNESERRKIRLTICGTGVSSDLALFLVSLSPPGFISTCVHFDNY